MFLSDRLCRFISNPSRVPEVLGMRIIGRGYATEDRSRRNSAHGGAPFRRKDYWIGVVLLLVVVLLWTVANFVTQALFKGGYHKPFLLTYLNTSSFTLYLLPFLAKYLWRRTFGEEVGLKAKYEALPVSEQDILDNTPPYGVHVRYVPTDVTRSDDAAQLAPLTTTETAHLASIICFFWFIANWSLNASLDYTSVANSTILSSTSGFFTLAIGRLFAVETLTTAKVAAVVTSFVGVLLVSLSDSSSPTTNASIVTPVRPSVSPVLGDLLALLGAAFYALYVILLKIRISSESRIDMKLFFGFVGLFNILALFPVGLLLHLTGYEPFELPSTGKMWGAVMVNMFITLSSDYLYVIAMLKTTPLLVTVGLSLTIPVAIVGDELLNIPTKTQALLGALLVLGGFGLVGREDSEPGLQRQVSRLEEEDTVYLHASDSERREVTV